MRRPWTENETAILRHTYPDTPTSTVARRLDRTESATYQRAQKLGLRKSPQYLSGPFAHRISGADNGHRFRKGLTPWNKGRKGWQAGGRSKETQFKPGTLNGAAKRNKRAIGSELPDAYGILLRKVADTGNRRKDWRPVHVLVWESVHGPVPARHIVIFSDRNRRNFDPANLVLVTRAENMRRNSYLTRYPKEVADVMRLRGALNRKINMRSKQ